MITLAESKGFELERKTYFEVPTPPGFLSSLINVGTLGFCPNVPKGYVYCVGAADPRRICPNTQNCPGALRGLIKKEKLMEIEEKLMQKELEKMMPKEEAQAYGELQKDIYKKQLSEIQKINSFAGVKNFILSPIGVALIGGIGLLLFLMLKKK